MKIAIIISLILTLSLSFNLSAQEEFNVEIEPVVISNSPIIDSYSFGQITDDK